MLNKHSAVPLHVQLADILRSQIRKYDLSPGARLPSERELGERYAISRITVRKALAMLQQDGLLYTTMGKGTYVHETTLQEALQPLSGFTEDIRRRGLSTTSRVLEACLVSAEASLAARLRTRPGMELVKLRRLRFAGEIPVAEQLTFLPHHLCQGLLAYDFSAASLYQILRTEYRLKLHSAETTLEADIATPEQADLLQLTSPAPVLISEQTTCLESGVVIEATRSVFAGQRYKLFIYSQ